MLVTFFGSSFLSLPRTLYPVSKYLCRVAKSSTSICSPSGVKRTCVAVRPALCTFIRASSEMYLSISSCQPSELVSFPVVFAVVFAYPDSRIAREMLAPLSTFLNAIFCLVVAIAHLLCGRSCRYSTIILGTSLPNSFTSNSRTPFERPNLSLPSFRHILWNRTICPGAQKIGSWHTPQFPISFSMLVFATGEMKLVAIRTLINPHCFYFSAVLIHRYTRNLCSSFVWI